MSFIDHKINTRNLMKYMWLILLSGMGWGRVGVEGCCSLIDLRLCCSSRRYLDGLTFQGLEGCCSFI